MNLLNVFFRLFLATVSGALIGSDRVLKGRPAGIKTHALVALGASVAMLTGDYIAMEYGLTQEVGRLAAQVISGIGFLGAGTIIVTSQKQVSGLTTAAGLWFAGIVGISSGGGYYEIVLFAIITWAFIFFVLGPLDDRLSTSNAEYKLYLSIKNERALLNAIIELDRLNINITKKESLFENDKIWIIYGILTKEQQKFDFHNLLGQLDDLEVVDCQLDYTF